MEYHPTSAVIPWRGRTVYLYLADGLDVHRDSILGAVRHAIASSNGFDLEDRLRVVAEDHDIALASYVDRPDHSDPLGERITVAFRPFNAFDFEDE